MTKKWNEALPEIKTFKVPSLALKALPFPYFISFKPVSWYLKAITFPFECCLPITSLHTLYEHFHTLCEHKRLLAPNKCFNATRWSRFCTNVTLYHHHFLGSFPDTWHKNASRSNTLPLKELVSYLTYSPCPLIWPKKTLENSSHGRAPSMHMYKFMLNIILGLHSVVQFKSFPELLHSRS